MQARSIKPINFQRATGQPGLHATDLLGGVVQLLSRICAYS